MPFTWVALALIENADLFEDFNATKFNITTQNPYQL